MAAHFISKIIRHRPPTTDLANPHPVPRQQVHPDPNAVNQHDGRYGNGGIYKDGTHE